ncbi:MAG: zinc-binding dehydrogenase [bacterium]
MKNAQVVFAAPLQVEIESRGLRAPGRGEVLIETICSLISNGTEGTLLAAAPGLGETWSKLASFPRDVGYSNVGRVVECGAEVDASWRDRIVSSHGPHAAWITVRADELRPVPDGVDPESAAFTTLAEVALNGLRRGALAWGERALVCGLGLLGQLTARAAAFAGARPVIGTDRSPSRMAKLPRTPSFVAIPADADALDTQVRAAAGGALVDVAFEVSGHPDAMRALPALVREQGRIVVLSSPSGETRFDFHDGCNRASLSIIGTHYFSHPPRATADAPWSAQRHAEIFLAALAHGEMEVASLISHRFPYTRAADAYRAVLGERDAALAVVLDWRESEGRP